MEKRRITPDLKTSALTTTVACFDTFSLSDTRWIKWNKWKPDVKETCVLAFSETQLSRLDQEDEDLNYSGFGSLIHLDQDPETTKKC